MRTYHVFKINNYFSYMYGNKPYKIYKILEEIYHTKEYDMILTYKLYEQIAITFNKLSLNQFVTYKLGNIQGYYFNNNTHVIANNYEYSKLLIANANLKIKTNVNYPSFFDIIEDKNIFICDFMNKDYFWLHKIKQKDGQNNNYLVK